MAKKKKKSGPIVPFLNVTTESEEPNPDEPNQPDAKSLDQQATGTVKEGAKKTERHIPFLMDDGHRLGVPAESAGQSDDAEETAEPELEIRKRVNAKLFVVLPIVAGVLGVGVHFLHAYQVERSASVLFDRAETLLKNEKPKEAVRYLRQYVGFRPDDVEALVQLAETLQTTAQTPRDHLRAYLTFEQVLRRDASRKALRRKQVKRAIRFRRLGDARVHLRVLLEEFPQDGELRFFAGVVEEADRHFDKAATYDHAAIASGYKTVEVHVRLARILRERQTEPQAADRIMDAMVKEHPDAANAWLMRAIYRKEYGTLQQALEDITKAEKLDPETNAALLFRAEWILSGPNRSQTELKEVRDKLNNQLATHPQEPQLYRLLSQAELRLKHPKRAIEVLQLGRQALPDDIDLIWPLAEMLISAGKLDEADREIDRLQELKAARWIVDYLKGRVLYKNGRILAAKTRLESAATGADRDSGVWQAAHLLLGQCYRQMGAFQRQLDTCGQIVDADPLSAQGRLGMAQAYEALGRTEEALKIYISMPASPGVLLRKARLLFLRNRQSSADKQNWSAVETILNGLTKKGTHSLGVALMRAELFVARGQRKQAVDFLEQLQKHHPKNAQVRCTLAHLAIRTHDWKRAESILAKTRNELGDSLNWRIAQADLWNSRPGPQSDKMLDGLEQGLASFSSAEQLQVRKYLAEIWDARGNAKRSARLWQQIATAHPYLIEPRFRRFLLAYSQGDEPAMRKSLAALRAIEGQDGLHVAVAKAAVLIQTGQYENRRKAEAMLNRVAEQRPNWTLVYLLRARIDEENESTESAVAQYQRAIELGARDPKILRRTLDLLSILEHYHEIEQLLTTLSRDTSASVLLPMQRAAAEASLQTRDFKRALTLARTAVRPDSVDPKEHTWLGQVYSMSGSDKDAEREFRKAIELDPTQPKPRVALIQFLLSRGRRPQAEQAVDEAASQLKGKDSALVLGLCNELVGRLVIAEQYYQTALSADSSHAEVVRNVAAFYLRNRHPEKAEPLLHRMLDPENPFPKTSLPWARRSLAGIVGNRDYKNFIQAIAMLDRNLTASQNSVPDLLTKARLLASHPGSRYRRDAVAIFEKLASQKPLNEPDQKRLAILYDVLGQTQTANTHWHTLLKTHTADTTILAAYVRRELQKKQLPEAERWWKRLDKIAPKLPVTVELHARLLAQKHQAAEAIELLQNYVRGDTPAVAKKGPDETARIGRLTQAAVWVFSLCNSADRTPVERNVLSRRGRKWFRDLVARRPQIALAFANCLARMKKTGKALDVLESVATKLPSLQVTAAGIAVVRSARGNAAQIQRVDQWLERLQKKHPHSSDVLLQQAELRIIQERYEDAIVLYRTVLRAHPHHTISLNNLAWYLSMFKRQNAEARKLIDEALDVVGPVAAYLETRGSVRLNQGDTNGAIQDFREALMQSESPLTRFRLAQANDAAGNPAAAALNLHKANQAGLNADQLDTFERKAYLDLTRKIDTPSGR